MAASRSKDEIGELSIAFNNMVSDIKKLSELTLAQEKEKQAMLASQNEDLEKQVEERTVELRQSLEELKTTQTQLIQSEKMASLGELTAGIAHEIQNPLNFVNNFSDLNAELLDELKQELEAGNKEEVFKILQDLKENEQKITHHGKRADAIVKGMLQHSRSGNGQKEPTDINALCDEYLRLAYHGLRAKDKSFNAKLDTHYDATMGKINAVPQDLGRVLLNLFTNAFYSVMQKRKQLGEGFESVVSVNTTRSADRVEIKVRDNGTGIPQKALDKIYQPFFTTKPTGEGTGLGLSMSYDIITKGHGGELKVETREGEFAAFTIILPI
ncbi:MAG: ATP-binding protein [Bacteroidota bacterium]